MVKLGSVVSGIVDLVTPNAVFLHVNVKGNMKGTIFTEHLADHHGHAIQLKSVLKPGLELPQLLVLEIDGNNLILSAKYSLVHAAPQFPVDTTQIHQNTLIHGYVCNLIETGCFVRFLGRLTGFCPRKKALDDRSSDLCEAFFVGQSVRSHVLDIDNTTSRITLSLKQSNCSSTDASFLQSYFLTEQKIAELQSSDSGSSELDWVESFSIGSAVEGRIHEAKDFGLVISFETYSDVFGFITQSHLGGSTLETGSIIQAVVLDVSKSERLVDLSLKPEFVQRSKKDVCQTPVSKKKSKREVKELKVHETVNAIVEIVKEDYLVVSLPEYDYTIGFMAVTDYNTQKLHRRRFSSGETVITTIMALPCDTTCGRLLLLLESSSQAAVTSSFKKAKKRSAYDVGSLVQAEVTEIKPLELRVKFGIGFHGRVHITEVNDENVVEDPFSNYKVGQTLTAKIVANHSKSEKMKKASLWELAIKPSVLSGSSVVGEMQKVESALVQVESRALVPPLDVTLDDIEDDNVDGKIDEVENKADAADTLDEKNLRRAKRKAKEEKELEIRAAEQRLLEKDAPRTTDEFDKVVRTSPNSSFVWIKYMQFMLSMADVEGARSVAERALKTINITYEAEKLNIWVAYLNLENQYGNPREEAVTRLFQRALQFCDPLKLHLELLELYERTEQHNLADELLIKMCKKFRNLCEVWLRRIQWLLKQNPEGVDNEVKRALLCLPQHEHIKFLSQVAILDFKSGAPDKGRALFEKMLREYPKRRDLWSVYQDQEIRLGDVDLIRSLFERATSLSIPAKKMKFLFKKYLNYEKSLGDKERIQHVIQKANENVETAAA